MNYEWHERFAEIVCGGMTQQDLEHYEALAEAGFTEEAEFTTHEFVEGDE